MPSERLRILRESVYGIPAHALAELQDLQNEQGDESGCREELRDGGRDLASSISHVEPVVPRSNYSRVHLVNT